MTKLRASLVLAQAALSALAIVPLHAQKLPPTDSWPTYNGDYSGRRYSTLSKINQEECKLLDGAPSSDHGFHLCVDSRRPVGARPGATHRKPENGHRQDIQPGGRPAIPIGGGARQGVR